MMITNTILLPKHVMKHHFLTPSIYSFLPRIGFVNILRDFVSAVVIFRHTAMCLQNFVAKL